MKMVSSTEALQDPCKQMQMEQTQGDDDRCVWIENLILQ